MGCIKTFEEISNLQQTFHLQLTARQYVFVNVTRQQHCHESVPVGQKSVVPPPESGQAAPRESVVSSGGTSFIGARKLSRYIGFKVLADARFAQRRVAKLGVRVHEPLLSCPEGWSKSKKCNDWSREAGSLLTLPSVLEFRANFIPYCSYHLRLYKSRYFEIYPVHLYLDDEQILQTI